MTGVDYAEILEQVGVAVISIDRNGLIQLVNQATSSIFGYATEDMLGRNVSMLMPEHIAVRHDDYLRHHQRTGQTRIIGTGREVHGRRADGTVFPLHLSIGRHDSNGQPGFTGIIHDLSDQVQTHDRALRFGRIIDESSNEIYVFRTDDLKFTLVNQGALANLGYRLEEMLNMTPVDIKPEYDEDAFSQIIAPLIRGECPRVEFECTHLRQDGSVYETDVVLHLADPGSPVEIVAIIQDCTERNRMRRAILQSQRMEFIAQMSGGIAHDFNNLLTVITGNLELLEMSAQDAEQRELLKEAAEASTRGADLTSRLQSFAGQHVSNPTRLNLNHVVLDLSEMLDSIVGKDVLFRTIMSPELWSICVDQSQMDSALINLVLNAREAMPDGGSLMVETVNCSLTAAQSRDLNLPPGDYVQLSLSDSGQGISQEHLESIFEPFFSTKSRSENQGLGLSMVYGFARQSGGTLRVDSELGQGSRFTLLLPRDSSQQIAAVNGTCKHAEPSERAVILLVDDEESVRRLTARRLLYLGHTVIEAGNAAEALAAHESHPGIDMLLTDMVMPGNMSGMDLSCALRARQPDLPVVISSGHSEELSQTAISDHHALYLLGKPYSMGELENLLSRVLHR
ncbi:MAG: PAS domain S-box protein [Granulosicoccus sp.]|nr:PAS domain S-box protein [Granulosicoccus sp.]